MHVPPAKSEASASESLCDSPSLHWSEGNGWSSVSERLVVEAPLAVEIAYERQGREVAKLLAVTMRTPGADEELAVGFLHGEGLIAGREDVAGGAGAEENLRGEKIATWRVRLARPPREDLQRVSRGIITSSACGLCGRSTLEGLPVGSGTRPDAGERLPSCGALAALPEVLRRHQALFEPTGGCHGAALFSRAGELLLCREDVGRHNAVDKLVGAALLRGLPLSGGILALSGRASFELVQKAAAAGVAAVVAVSAPSSLAVNLANGSGITLIGFARGSRFNVYAHADRLKP